MPWWFWPLKRSARERDRDAEMRAHLDLFTEQLMDRGVAPEEAARQARLRFGNPRVKLEEIRDMNRLPILESLWRDARYAVRILARTPAFTVTAVVTLALVIGASTAVLSLADTLLWRPLPFPEPDRLAGIIRVETKDAVTTTTPAMDGAMFEAVRESRAIARRGRHGRVVVA
jgi:hypothetical protein